MSCWRLGNSGPFRPERTCTISVASRQQKTGLELTRMSAWGKSHIDGRPAGAAWGECERFPIQKRPAQSAPGFPSSPNQSTFAFTERVPSAADRRRVLSFPMERLIEAYRFAWSVKGSIRASLAPAPRKPLTAPIGDGGIREAVAGQPSRVPRTPLNRWQWAVPGSRVLTGSRC